MSSRGSKSLNGHVTTNEYHQVGDMLYDAKILEGNDKANHNLPDYSHTPSRIYIKLNNKDKSFNKMRIYDNNCRNILEIAIHPEPNVVKNRKPILHYHIINDDLSRSDAIRLNKDNVIYKKYKKYLERFGL